MLRLLAGSRGILCPINNVYYVWGQCVYTCDLNGAKRCETAWVRVHWVALHSFKGRFALGREDQEPRPLTNKRKRDAWKEGKRKSVSHRIFPPLTRLKNICS